MVVRKRPRKRYEKLPARVGKAQRGQVGMSSLAEHGRLTAPRRLACVWVDGSPQDTTSS